MEVNLKIGEIEDLKFNYTILRKLFHAVNAGTSNSNKHSLN
jgi:hypothetical protein